MAKLLAIYTDNDGACVVLVELPDGTEVTLNEVHRSKGSPSSGGTKTLSESMKNHEDDEND